jgi:PKD repeat protein
VTDTTITGNPYGGVELFRDGGSETSVQAGAWSIDDGLAPAPVAAFTGTPLSGTSPLSVAFDSSATTNTPTTHLWERKLGAGAWENFAGTPTVANPTEAFTAGTWSVRYTATNAGGSNTKTETDYVTVTAAAGGKSLAGSHSLDIWRGLGL